MEAHVRRMPAGDAATSQACRLHSRASPGLPQREICGVTALELG
jgi:hypothetical protein